MTSYSKGYRRERQTIKKLTKEGYVCIRSTGSHSPFDIVAIGETHVKLIQVKGCTGRPYVRPSVKTEIERVECPGCCDKEIWVYVKYSRDNPYISSYNGKKWVDSYDMDR